MRKRVCRREGINTNLYYRWSKEFLEAGKQRLAGDTVREATSDEVKQLRSEAAALKEALASFAEEPDPAGALLLPVRTGGGDQTLCGSLQQRALPRVAQQLNASARVLRP